MQVTDAKVVVNRPKGPKGNGLRVAECLVGDQTGIIVLTVKNEQGKQGQTPRRALHAHLACRAARGMGAAGWCRASKHCARSAHGHYGPASLARLGVRTCCVQLGPVRRGLR